MNIYKLAQGALASVGSVERKIPGPSDTRVGWQKPQKKTREPVKRLVTNFGPAQGRFTIGSIDDETLTVVAQYNPSQLQMDRTINWQQKDNRDNRPDYLRRSRQGDSDDVEFTGAEARTFSFELVLDGVERGESIESDIEMLEEMACARNPDSSDDTLRRPHHCVVTFGQVSTAGIKPLRCVIKSLSVKYSMFNACGAPLRASVTVTVREAYRLKGYRKDA